MMIIEVLKQIFFTVDVLSNVSMMGFIIDFLSKATLIGFMARAAIVLSSTVKGIAWDNSFHQQNGDYPSHVFCL